MKGFFGAITSPICFFDSGIGGLNLLRECALRLPNEKFIYFADNYNVPYGDFSKNKLLGAADAVFEKMSGFNPSAAVIACNTVTAQCADFLRAKYSFPIIGIQPAVKPAAFSATKCVVLATPSTAASASVTELISRYGNGVTRAVACPELATYIERNIFNIEEKSVLKLLPLIDADAIVIGCTHYSYVKEIIRLHYRCPVYDGLEGTARRLLTVLGKTDHFNENKEFNNGTDRKKTILNEKNISFLGGDEVKNARVFSKMISHG